MLGQECKYERNEIDKFTGKTIKETKRTTVYTNKLDPQSKSMFFRFNKIDTLYYVNVSKWYNDIISISEGNKLMIMFDNNISITLFCLKYAISKSYSGKWHIDVNFYISNSDLNMLKTKNITDIRLYTNSGYIEDKVKLENAEKIKISANCLEN
jgi:hypothetical protein